MTILRVFNSPVSRNLIMTLRGYFLHIFEFEVFVEILGSVGL